MADELDPIAEDPFVMAGEFALGVLEGSELAAAQRRQWTDRNFADAVDWWNIRLASMGEATEALLPSAAVWRGIEAEIGRLQDDAPQPIALQPASRRPAPWSVATALAGAALAAVALALFLARPSSLPPIAPPIIEARGPQLVAQLQDEESGRKLAGLIDAQNTRLSLKIAGLEPEAGKAPELWVIPVGGKPISLGYIPQRGEFSRGLSSDEAALMREGATLAVTFEEDIGSRHEAPTPPILLAGTLDQV